MTTTISKEYTVRPVLQTDLDRAIEVWSLSFGFADQSRWAQFYHSMLDIAIGAYYDDLLVTIAGVINFQMWFGDKLVPCAGISAVAADPAHRRRGLVRRCIEEALQHSYDKRTPLTALWPFSYPFYSRMGWKVTDLQYVIETPAKALPDLGNSTNYRRIDFRNFQELKPIHDRWVSQSNLSIKRGDLQWRRLVNHPHRDNVAYVHDEGYMLWNVKNNPDRTLDVYEWAPLSERAYVDGLSLLRRMDDLQYDHVRWTTDSPESYLAYGVSDPLPKIKIKPGMMTRVLHTDAFVELFDGKVPTLLVNDPLAVSGSFGQYGGTNGQVGLDPGEIIQAVTGFWSRKPAHIPSELFDLFPHKNNFTIEFF
ncbi:MAG: GNAT family N-acetyltransferase [Cyanobacteria bacterium]|nr:GNAT family N-acetyltransferase [Cyanobacteriota bacterium]